MPKWTQLKIAKLYDQPFLKLMHQAQLVHQKHFSDPAVEICQLLSIKTGSCPEDCAYCPQSAHYHTDIEKQKLLDLKAVIEKAKEAKQKGVKRFCMGAAWRTPPKKDFPKVLEMIAAVKNLGLETCVTLGMLTKNEASQLKEAGLDYYNHNLDTSPRYYQKIISTRHFNDRLITLQHVRDAQINVCCGGIIGMGETKEDRINFLWQLVSLPSYPESVPINRLIPIEGTPLSHLKQFDSIEFVRTIAVARIIMPRTMIRLAAGREDMSKEMQALCFMAGANSIFYGDKLLTADNVAPLEDQVLLNQMGVHHSLSDPCVK